jgi:hypothetical protein
MPKPVFLADLPPRIKDEVLTAARNHAKTKALEVGASPEQAEEYAKFIITHLPKTDLREFLEGYYGFNPLETPEC